MSEGPTLTPLAYATGPRRVDSVFGVVGFALAVVCAAVPAFMAWQLLTGRRHAWGVYTPYAADVGVVSFGGNSPWYALDVLALLLGLTGVQRGRPRFGVAAVALAALSLGVVMTIVLGSPW